MLVATGTFLVLATWIACIVGLVLVGLPFSVVSHDGAVTWEDVRRSLWWGLAITAVAVMAIANAVPLGDSTAMIVLLAMILLGAIASALLVRSRGWTGGWCWSSSLVWIIALSALPMLFLAAAALGPVTNFDSGLYHLSAIAHAADYAAIPGLANLYAPLGYTNAGFPLAAALGSGPWAAEGYRLLNGLIITMVLVDLVIRWARPRRSAGAYGLLVSAVVLIVPMVALSDYWVTSPSQDSAVFAVTIAAAALVMSGVARERNWLPDLAAGAGAGLLLVLLRPTMGAFLVGVLVVTGVLRLRRTVRQGLWRRWWLVVGTVGVAAAVVQVARDYVLSGWLLYPLSVWSFDVPWLAVDPEGLRTPTLGFHRDPVNLWQATEGFGWVPAWFSRLPQQWEFWMVVTLAAAALVLAVITRANRVTVRARGMVLAVMPSLVMAAVWWVATPPSFRFAWGAVFTVFTVPIGWLLWRMADGRNHTGPRDLAAWIVAGAALPVLAVTAYSAAARLDVSAMTVAREWDLGVTLTYSVAPAPVPETERVELGRGLVVQVPRDGGLCWAAFPLCTPSPDARVGYLMPDEGLPGGLSVD